MSVLSTLVGGGVGTIIDAVGTAVDKVHTSEAEKLAAQAVLEQLRSKPAELQAEINKIEAAHRSIWVAGWRPYIGWVCGTAIAWHFMGHEMAAWFFTLVAPGVEPPPQGNPEGLITVLLSLLGLAGMRSYEKTKGVAG